MMLLGPTYWHYTCGNGIDTFSFSYQENMHLIDYVIASEWVQPQWLKFLFGLLYNLSILFYRNKQVEEVSGKMSLKIDS